MSDRKQRTRSDAARSRAAACKAGRIVLVDVREPNETGARAFPRRGAGAALGVRSGRDPGPDRARSGVRLPLRPPLGDGLARRAGAGFCLWRAHGRRNTGLEGRRTADRDVTWRTDYISRMGLPQTPSQSAAASPASSARRRAWRRCHGGACLRCSRLARHPRARRQLLQLVGLSGPDGARRLHARRAASPSATTPSIPTIRWRRSSWPANPATTSWCRAAYFLARQITAGIFQKLDKSKLPNLANAWPEIANQLAVYDPGNQYAVNYMWGTTGIGYNVKDGQGASSVPMRAIDSWDYVFDPDKIAKFKDCGIHLLDSSDDIMPAALHYLHLDPNSQRPGRSADKATDLSAQDQALRAQISFLGISQCAGDRRDLLRGRLFRRHQTGAKARRRGQRRRRDRLFDPEGGRAIVVRQSRHPERRAAPRRSARTDQLSAQARSGGEEHQLRVLRQRRCAEPNSSTNRSSTIATIYPDAATMAKLYTIIAHDPKTQRVINRLWTRIKTGE